MNTYKRYTTVQENGRIVLSDLPFKVGQQVEVLLIAKDKEPSSLVKEFKKLFKRTQALPQVQTITDDDINTEIEDYRAENFFMSRRDL